MRVVLGLALAAFGLLAPAAPVPKGLKAKSFEQKLLGTWELVDAASGPRVFLDVRAGGEFVCRVEPKAGAEQQEYRGRYTVTRGDDPAQLPSVLLEFPERPNLNEDWVVREVSDDRLKVIDTTRGSKDEYTRVR